MLGNGRLGALVGGYAHEEVVPISIAVSFIDIWRVCFSNSLQKGLHVISGNKGADAVLSAMKDGRVTSDGRITPNYYPYIKIGDTYAPFSKLNSSRNLKSQGKVPISEVFRESRKALLDGDTGISQQLLALAVDDNAYGQTQYAFDMVIMFFSHAISLKSKVSHVGNAVGRMGRLMQLKQMIDLGRGKAPPPLSILHSRSSFNTLTGN